MGSLMAGWSSPNQDPKSGRISLLRLPIASYQRNKSFTKGEIEAYWRSKKTPEDEYLKAALGSKENIQVGRVNELGLQRSNSMPMTDRKGNFLIIDPETAQKKLIQRNDWWTRGNLAFLNEPPVIASESPSYKYASQYHITNFGSSKPDTPHGIST